MGADATPAGKRQGCLAVLVAMAIVAAALAAVLAFGWRAITHDPEPTPSITRSTR
jgi:hypothetical protein